MSFIILLYLEKLRSKIIVCGVELSICIVLWRTVIFPGLVSQGRCCVCPDYIKLNPQRDSEWFLIAGFAQLFQDSTRFSSLLSVVSFKLFHCEKKHLGRNFHFFIRWLNVFLFQGMKAQSGSLMLFCALNLIVGSLCLNIIIYCSSLTQTHSIAAFIL